MIKPGRYHAKVIHGSYYEAAVNGHAGVYPSAEMVYDGNWCVFYKDGHEVFNCNPQYATHNFTLKLIESETT